MKALLKSLAFVLNRLPKTEWKPIPLCHVYGRYGLNAPNLVGHVSAPSVSTGSASSITASSFTMGGNITSTGGENVTTRGFAYMAGAGGTPTTSNSTVVQTGSFGTGAYSLGLSGLAVNTTYSVRAFAINSGGTAYGSTVEVTTLNIVNDEPTVALNTANAASFATDTPMVEFTGSDTEGDDIRYHIQVSESNLFGGLDASNPTGTDYEQLYVGVDIAASQSFTSQGGIVDRAIFKGWRDGTPSGPAVAKIYAHAGTFGTSSVPTGSALATSDTVDFTYLSTTWANFLDIEFVFTGANKITLSPATNYCLVLEYNYGSSSSKLYFGNSWSSVHGGNMAMYNSNTNTWTANSAKDMYFYLYTSGIVAEAVSGTDAGFLNTVNGADTDPFTAGQKVSYTVQAADSLADGTYYWRVQGSNPAGTNLYGDWSETRNFTITDGGGGTVDPPAGGTAVVWTGSAWEAKPFKYYDGSAFTEKPDKVWDGTSWV